ncbi:MAG: ATP-binding protein [Burkholderiales bacterium]
MSIRARLMLLVLSVLVPAMVAALWIITNTYQSERRTLDRNLRDTAHALAMVVDRELAQRQAIVKVLSLARTLDQGADISAEDLARFDNQARRAMDGLDGWLVLSSEYGELLSTHPVAAPPAPAASADVLKQQPAVIGLRRPDAESGYAASIVQPVVRDGKTVLNLAIAVPPASMQKIIDDQGTPSDWVSTLMDNNGRVVARQPGGASYIGRSASPDLLQAIRAQRAGWIDSTTLDGVPVRTYYTTSASGWTQLVGVPRAHLTGWLPAAVWQMGAGGLLVLVLALLGAAWVSRRITGPIDQLKDAAARLGRGEPVPALSTGIRECDAVAAALSEAGQAQREARSTLEQAVGRAVERTREAEQRVSHNQRVEALGRLTGGVAHDFNNLLGVVSNSAYLIQRQGGEGPLQASVAAILRAVEVGSRLTQHLLRFAGRQPVSPQTMDPAVQLPEARELVKAVLGSSIRLSIEVAPGTRPVTVDASELELALINLSLNARDAMPRGGEVRVRARNAEAQEFDDLPAGDFVVITVSDTGGGIDPAVMERVFEPFFTTKSVGKGTGLGLSQVHGFCQQAGGTARVTSTAGFGTTVWLLLPAAQGDVQQAVRPAPDAAAQALDGRSVLLVEDNESLGDVTAALLASSGCLVQRAYSAEQALALFDAGETFDVVLSDVVMPGAMDGLHLARELRRRHPALPIVLISGYARDMGANTAEFEVLNKPCPPQALAAALARAMQAAGKS